MFCPQNHGKNKQEAVPIQRDVGALLEKGTVAVAVQAVVVVVGQPQHLQVATASVGECCRCFAFASYAGCLDPGEESAAVVAAHSCSVRCPTTVDEADFVTPLLALLLHQQYRFHPKVGFGASLFLVL